MERNVTIHPKPKDAHGSQPVDPSVGDSLWIPAGWGPEMSCNTFLATACAQAQERARVNATSARMWRDAADMHPHGSQPWAYCTVEFLFAAAFAEYEYEQARDHYAGAFYRLRVYPMAGGEEGGGSMAGGEEGGGFCGDSDGVYAVYGAARGGSGKSMLPRAMGELWKSLTAGGEEGGGSRHIWGPVICDLAGGEEGGRGSQPWAYSYHYARTCEKCGHVWHSLHCLHDGVQTSCMRCGHVHAPVLT